MNNSGNPIFSLRDVFCAYDGVDAITDLRLDIAAGGFTGIIGRNGAGKTTLFRLMTGALRPRLGEVMLAGRDLRGMPPRERARLLAIVPQMEDMVFPFTVEAMVLLGRAPYLGYMGYEREEDIDAAGRAMQQAGVADFAKRKVTDLSGGELHRVLIARALAQEAPVLLLDEPNAHLDLQHQAELFELLRDLHGKGRSILCITHDLNLAARYCDRLLLFDAGRLVADGTPGEVLTTETVLRHFGVHVGISTDDGIPNIRLLTAAAVTKSS